MTNPTSRPRDWTIAAEPFDSPDAVRLRAAARVEIDGIYRGYPDRGVPLTPESVLASFVARDADGQPLGCGALVPAADEVLEIRRMWVRSDRRGSGVASDLLRAVEAEARRREAPALVHETGQLQPRTIRFYEREGFHRIAPFGPYVGSELSVCLAKVL